VPQATRRCPAPCAPQFTVERVDTRACEVLVRGTGGYGDPMPPQLPQQPSLWDLGLPIAWRKGSQLSDTPW
jgi:hypothetical protein